LPTTWKRALVTGASTGIGEAFARRLAAEGTALVLVARDQQRLQILADDLRAAHRVEVEVLAADLIAAEGADTVAARLGAEPAIDLLVNNAGMGSKGLFAELPLEGELRQVHLNVTALLQLTHSALRAMKARRAGTIINVSSISGLHPEVKMATHGATKAFVTSLTDALHEEARGTGVTLTVVLPGFVRTEFMERTGNAEGFPDPPKFMWLTPDQVAAAALKDARRGAAQSIAGRGYRVISGVIASAPRGVSRRLSGIASKYA
jgi:short-subunit dehydrogenase